MEASLLIDTTCTRVGEQLWKEKKFNKDVDLSQKAIHHVERSV